MHDSHPESYLREKIKERPLAQVQEAFFSHIRQHTLNAEARDALIEQLDLACDSKISPYLQAEKQNVALAMQQEKAPHPPVIEHPETALLWAINLAYLAEQPDSNLYQTELWKQFVGSNGVAQSEKENLAYNLGSLGMGVNSQTRIHWGELGSSFFFRNNPPMINMDFIQSLGMGMDAARSVAFHEMGHSILTRELGGKINQLDAEIRKKSGRTNLSPEELEQLVRLAAERELRFRIFDEAENNAVDRWTVHQSDLIRKDLGQHVNDCEATFVDGIRSHVDLSEDTPRNRFQHTKNAIRLSFFRNNGYFPDTEEGWRSAGINPDWITTADGKSGIPALKQLKELCGGKDGVENLQPTSEDMMYGNEAFAAAVGDYGRKRSQRIEEIYDTFIEHISEPLIQEEQQRILEEMQQGNHEIKLELPSGMENGSRPPEPLSENDESIEELERKRQQRIKAYADTTKPDKAQVAGKPIMDENDMDGIEPDKSGAQTITVPVVGDWTDYQAMVQRFSAEIYRKQQLIDQLRERQIEYENKTSFERSVLPEDNDMRRLDRGAHTQLIKKMLRHQHITENDTRRFELDRTHPVPSNLDIVLLLDASGSTRATHDTKGNSWPFSPLEAGMHAGCILNEACKNNVTNAKRHANFYMGMWGPSSAIMVAKPGDPQQDIGKRIASVISDPYMATVLSPSIRDTTGLLSGFQNRPDPTNNRTGYSHFIIFCDGGDGAENSSYEMLKRLMENCPMSSVDFIVIENGETPMDRMAKKLERIFPNRIKLHHFKSPADVIDGISDVLMTRIQNTPVTPTITKESKRNSLLRSYEAMREL